MAHVYKTHLKTFSVAMEPSEPGAYCANPRSAEPILRSIFEQLELDSYQEHFLIVCLDSKAKVVAFKVLSAGTETACLVSPAMIFRAALVLGGTTVILCHNHPSGDPSPSREDVALTERCRKVGETLGMPVADHIILGNGRFHSFRTHADWRD